MSSNDTNSAFEVVKEGKKIILPEGMAIPKAIEYLTIRMQQDNQPISVYHVIDVYPLEGLYALVQVLKARYGFVNLASTPDFFGSKPPAMVGMEIDLGVTVQVPWGRMKLPGIDGWLSPDFKVKADQTVAFVIQGEVLRKNEDEVTAIVTDLNTYTKTHSVFRGKALRVTFPDRDDKRFSMDPLYLPKIMDLSEVKENELIFSEDVDDMIRTSIYAPIIHTEACRKNKIPLKRGVLLEGPFGVGKTLTAYVTAKICINNGWTFIYVDKAVDLDRALALARQYTPAVIFAEDVDRALEGSDYVSEEVNNILNTIDGIDSKTNEIMVVLTTNHVDDINHAMLRPGRLDAVIPVRAPDATAVIKLVRLYARELLSPEEDLTDVGKILEGNIPAVIREVVERSKLAAIHHHPNNNLADLRIHSKDLISAANGMKAQIELLTPAIVDKRNPEIIAAETLGQKICEAAISLVSINRKPVNNKPEAKVIAEIPLDNELGQ